MEANLHREIALEELARLCGLSRFHFARAFKASVGRPPHAQLRRLRVERAKTLLATTDTPVGDVAAAVGYETHQAFSRMFIAQTGVPPSTFRRGAK